MTGESDDPADEDAERTAEAAGGNDDRDREAESADVDRGDEVVAGDRDAPPGEEGAPLSDLREEVARRRERRGENRTTEDVFEEVGGEDLLEGEEVWDELLEGETETDAAERVAFAEPVADADAEAGDVRVIPDRVCHSCEFFGAPPELHCEHEGTDILRVVDMDHYEVSDCPMVRGRTFD